ncbi:MAG TPA: hypothetical protein VM077_02600 [Candidatus Limnocylindrales bacterium]|nr:hypothetical protein [Candidatus Limnocylindrales bacterium]
MAESKPRGRVNTVQDEALNNPSVPYTARFDADLGSALLREGGMPAEEIDNYKVKEIRRFPRQRRTLGYHSFQERTITLAHDPLWKKRKKKNTNPSMPFIHEASHAIDYATGRETVEASREMNSIRRSLSATAGTLTFVALTKLRVPAPSNILFGIAAWDLTRKIAYQFSAEERRARKFAKELGKDARWKDIVVLAPKQKR